MAEEGDGSGRPMTAFISGPLEVSQAYFERYYRPSVDNAISAGHHFVLGPVSGIDCLALDYLLSRSVPPSHIAVYMGGFEMDARPAFVEEIRNKLAADSVVEAKQADGQDARSTWDRDAAMTRASDYDILRFRTEWESKVMYGDRWLPRVSNTERNWRRRRGDACEQHAIGYISHATAWEVKMRKFVPWTSSNPREAGANERAGIEQCDGACTGHADVSYLPLLLRVKVFGSGNDGQRSH